MGVLNLTPDSFFDGGKHLGRERSREQIDALLEAGSDIIDIGAESSRPGANPVPASTQLERIGDAIAYAVARQAFVSVDTTDVEVAEQALRWGVHMVNDVSCLRDSNLARAAARHGAWLVVTHCRAPMAEMRGFSQWPDDDYADIVEDVASDWGHARQVAMEVGVPRDRIIFDPGLGFSKNARHSYVLLERLRSFRSLEAPILVGPGRKSFLAAVDASPPSERLGGTIAASLAAARQGADILRIHDVFEVRQALCVASVIERPERLSQMREG